MKKIMLFALIGLSISVFAQTEDEAYLKVVTARAEKIVTGMKIEDASIREPVTETIAMQYFNLNKIYSRRDAQIKQLKDQGKKDEAITKQIETRTTASTDSLHTIYLENLAKWLNQEQIAQVKDGMTYGVLPITYTGYLDMIPSLTGEQKKVIMDELLAAREKAMDAESSDKKHWWFGKHKGRINNYLSAQGYDTQKERAAWEARMKAAGKKF